MRAFSAIATMMSAISASPSETRKPTSDDSMKAAMVESCVEPATSASVNTIISMAGSASEAIITSRLEPMPPKGGADVEPGQRQEKARAAEQRDDGDEIRRPGEIESAAEGRHQRGRHPGGGEDDVGDDAEQPGGALRQHHVLAHQADKVAIGLQQRRPAPALQPRLHFSHEAGEQRRQQQHQQHLRALEGVFADQGHIANTSSSSTSAANTSER